MSLLHGEAETQAPMHDPIRNSDLTASSPAGAARPDFNERFGFGYGNAMARRWGEAFRRAPAYRSSHRHHRAVAALSRTPERASEHRGSPLPMAADAIFEDALRIAGFVRQRIVQQSCLATAVYFEARSESQDGQLAVATVILNRVKARNFPSSICAVVYQGSSRLNACQFSFACDGKPDVPKPGKAWQVAVTVASEALADDDEMDDATLKGIAGATHYHADYVKPRWSRSLTRLSKIGHHIFYTQGQTS